MSEDGQRLWTRKLRDLLAGVFTGGRDRVAEMWEEVKKLAAQVAGMEQEASRGAAPQAAAAARELPLAKLPPEPSTVFPDPRDPAWHPYTLAQEALDGVDPALAKPIQAQLAGAYDTQAGVCSAITDALKTYNAYAAKLNSGQPAGENDATAVLDGLRDAGIAAMRHGSERPFNPNMPVVGATGQGEYTSIRAIRDAQDKLPSNAGNDSATVLASAQGAAVIEALSNYTPGPLYGSTPEEAAAALGMAAEAKEAGKRDAIEPTADKEAA